MKSMADIMQMTRPPRGKVRTRNAWLRHQGVTKLVSQFPTGSSGATWMKRPCTCGYVIA